MSAEIKIDQDIMSGELPEGKRTEVPLGILNSLGEGPSFDPTRDEATVIPAQNAEATLQKSGDAEGVLGQLAGGDFERTFGMPDIYAQENAQPQQTAPTESIPLSREQQLNTAKAEFLKSYSIPPPNQDINSEAYRQWAQDRDHTVTMQAEASIQADNNLAQSTNGPVETIQLPDSAHIQWQRLGVERRNGQLDFAGVPAIAELRNQQNILYNETLAVNQNTALSEQQRQEQRAAIEQRSQALYTQFARDNRELTETMARVPQAFESQHFSTEQYVNGLRRVQAEETRAQADQTAPESQPSAEVQLASARAEFIQIYDTNNRPPNDNPDSPEYKAWAVDRDRKANLYARAMVERNTLEQNASRQQTETAAAGETPNVINESSPENQTEQTPPAREIPPAAQRLYDRANEMRGRADTLRTQAGDMEQQAQRLREQATALPPTPEGQVRYNTGMAGEASPREQMAAQAQQLENRARSMRNRAENLDRLADIQDEKGKQKEEQAEAKKQEAINMREEQGKELASTMEQAMKELGFDAKAPMTLEEQRQMFQKALEITNDKLKNAKGSEKRKLMGILKALGLILASAVVLAGSLLTEQGNKLADRGEQMKTAVTG